MRRRNLLGAAWLAIGLCGCATFRPERLPERLDTARACADWRWIGITGSPGIQCPEVKGWTVKPLFSQVTPPPDSCKDEYSGSGSGASLVDTIRELNRFCVYEIKNPYKRSKGLPFPPAASAGLARFDQDCAALAIAADSKKKKKKIDWEPDSMRFFEQAGKTALPEIDTRPTVRLAFLDTQPTGEGLPQQWWHSGHGYALAHIARNLICSPENSERCAAQITTQLALPILEFDSKDRKSYKTDETLGGYIGLQSHLADAIRKEVDSWREDRLQREGAPRHLVLNLSLAWDGDLFGGLDEKQVREMKAGTQAVYFALRYAANFDVLVLAAAGNQKREPCSNRGPLLPAAWEGTTLCEENCKTRVAPLVYAVGGLQTNGNLLGNARHQGMPVRAACGENAVMPTSDPDFPMVMYTGSSVATAVVSSIAAVVWNRYPDLTSSQLMVLIDKNGNSLPHPVDFWSRTSVPPTPGPRRVSRHSLCSTLQNICNDTRFKSSRPPSSPLFCLNASLPCPEPAAHPAPVDEPPTQGSCQPWLYPQPEDPPRPNCNDGCPPRN